MRVGVTARDPPEVPTLRAEAGDVRGYETRAYATRSVIEVRAEGGEMTSIPTGPTAHGDDIQPGEVLNFGNSIWSANREYTFVFQSDGNLVLYRHRDMRPLWASGTDRQP